MSEIKPVVFRSSHPNVGFVFRDGNRISFQGSRMVLTNPEYIAEMREAVKSNSTLREDTEDAGFESEDSFEAIKAKIIAEHEAAKVHTPAAPTIEEAVTDKLGVPTAPLESIIEAQVQTKPAVSVNIKK